jgi:hypothetical protein
VFIADVSTVCCKDIQKRINEVYSQQNSALHHSGGCGICSTNYQQVGVFWLPRKLSTTSLKASYAVSPFTAMPLSQFVIHDLLYVWTDELPVFYPCIVYA